MPTVVKAKPDESTDSVIRRFKKKVFSDDILTELKKREFYRKPSLDKKEKQAISIAPPATVLFILCQIFDHIIFSKLYFAVTINPKY